MTIADEERLARRITNEMERLERQRKKHEVPEVKICPFCEGNPEIERNDNHFRVFCNGQQNTCFILPTTDYCPTEEQAIALWNRRGKII